MNLIQIDPAKIAIGANIRSIPTLDPEFVESIRQFGVLQPVVVYPAPDGEVMLAYGQRRTLGAIAAKRDTIPAIVLDGPPADVERVYHQWVENEQREGLSVKDKAVAVDQLALFGVSAGEIATALSLAPEEVVAAQKVAKSQTALDHSNGLSLEFAELLAEFEDDAESVDHILQAADEDEAPEHVAAFLREGRERTSRYDAAVADLEKGGVKVIDAPQYPWPASMERVSSLNGSDGKRLDATAHAECPGHAVYVQVIKRWRQNDSDDPWETTVVPVCTDWPANGHKDPYLQSRTGQDTPKKKAADMTDEEREKARVERRHVIDSKKAWVTATPVRRKWLLEFGARKEAPAGAEVFIARTLHSWITLSKSHLPLVGLEQDKTSKELARASVKRATHITLAIAVASIEEHLNDDAWRSQLDHAGPYLEALGKWGYPLSDIEKRMINDAKKGKK